MEFRVQVRSGGRFVLPSKIRKELQIKPGDEIVLRLENGSVRLVPLHQAVSIAQQTVKKICSKRNISCGRFDSVP